MNKQKSNQTYCKYHFPHRIIVVIKLTVNITFHIELLLFIHFPGTTKTLIQIIYQFEIFFSSLC